MTDQEDKDEAANLIGEFGALLVETAVEIMGAVGDPARYTRVRTDVSGSWRRFGVKLVNYLDRG